MSLEQASDLPEEGIRTIRGIHCKHISSCRKIKQFINIDIKTKFNELFFDFNFIIKSNKNNFQSKIFISSQSSIGDNIICRHRFQHFTERC